MFILKFALAGKIRADVDYFQCVMNFHYIIDILYKRIYPTL